MNDIEKAVSNIGIIPVIALDDVEKAVPLAKALIAGGLPAAEVTFRTAAAEESIRRMAAECPEMLVGAGTVLNIEQCDRAIAAGAKFIVSPGYNHKLVKYCVEKGVVVLPGCVNASDMTRAMNDGLQIVKFFPAEASGGVAFLKNLAPVFPKLSFMPTGGVNTKNLMDYLGWDRIIACGGTWMVKKDLIEGECWDEITAICKDAVKAMLGFELAHVGLNCENEAEAERIAKAFSSIFGFEYKPGNSSIFAGKAVECNKAPGRGAKGHIGIGVNDVDRAMYHLGRQGVEFIEDSYKADAKGKGKAVYLKEEFGGFAVHLMKK